MAVTGTLTLLRDKRFWPLMVTQFMGAFNDNLFRSAILTLVTYKLAEQIGISAGILNNMALALFMAPFFLFSALAGELADRYEKSKQIFRVKLWEVGLMIVGALGFYYQSTILLFAVLTGLGIQSSFFGPLKYGILPDLVRKDELIAANALIEAGTFISILIGTSIGTLVVLAGFDTPGDTSGAHTGLYAMSGLTFLVSLIGLWSSRRVLQTPEAAPNLRIRKNIFASTTQKVRTAWGHPICRRAIILLSWMWTVGSVYLTQIPVLTKDYLHGDEQVITLFLAVFSVGVGIGSLATNKLLHGQITARLVLPGLITLTLVSVAMFLITPAPAVHDTAFMGVFEFLSRPVHWFIMGLLAFLSLGLGTIMVPLYAILQNRSNDDARSQTIAANNIFNSLFMVIGAGIAAVLISLGASTLLVLLLAGIVGLGFLGTAKKLEKLLVANPN